MKRKVLFAVSAFLAAVSVLVAVALAQQPAVTYKLIATIPMPGVTAFDISWTDAASSRFYLAARGPAQGSGSIQVIDTQALKLLTPITGFVGTVAPPPACAHSGPNGVVLIPQMNQLYVGDGDSTVKVVDLAKQAIVATINTGGKCRADEIGYDPLDHIIMIANPGDSPSFVSFISADTQTIVGQYTYSGAQTGGLEQPVWSPLAQRFFFTVPATAGVSEGTVDVFNAKTFQREASYPIGLGCSPAGLALTPDQHLMTSCGVALDTGGGRIAGVGGVSADEIWYNSGDNRYYIGTAVVDADSNRVIATLPGAAGTRNGSVDSATNYVFAPYTKVSGSAPFTTVTAGVRVFAAQ